MSTDTFGASGSDAQQTLQSFWPRVMEEIRNLTVVRWLVTRMCAISCALFFFAEPKSAFVIFQKDFRVQELPLARIKKIMKLDEDVKVRGLSDFA